MSLALLGGYVMDTMALQKQYVVLYLNRGSYALGVYRCSLGGLTATIADIRLILSVALRIATVCVILSHNHPSRNFGPSGTDRNLTEKLKNAARLMDIQVLDHLNICGNGKEFYSLADEGEI